MCDYRDIYINNLFNKYMTLETENNIAKKEIIKTWLGGQYSCTLIIPKEFAKEYGLNKPSHVILEGTSEGILIRKLEI
jgi:hypothetical protein